MMVRERRIHPRWRAAGLVVAALLLVTAVAFGGSYLSRASLLLAQATSDADYLRGRLADKELARLVHKLAVARLDAADKMEVPKEVAQAHPHLLLVLENYERAADAAENSAPHRFLIYQQRARDEERTLRGVLKQLGWELPK